MLLMFHLNMTHKLLMIVYFMHKSHVKVGVQFLLVVRTYLDICILLYNTLGHLVKFKVKISLSKLFLCFLMVFNSDQKG